MANPANDPALFLDWDSNFFNKRIGRVQTHTLTQKDAEAVDDWAAANRIDCVYYLADGSDLSSSNAAENAHYHLVDLRVTYQIDLSRVLLVTPATERIRKANENDLPLVRQMARENHKISRFFADGNFDVEKCKELYEVWIERDFHEEEHFLWVWDVGGKPVAYTSASYNLLTKKAGIGLVGVHTDFQGQGIGLDLQTRVLVQLKALGVEHVEVVTQGRNINGQNLYKKSGYRLKSIDLWYHKWYQN